MAMRRWMEEPRAWNCSCVLIVVVGQLSGARRGECHRFVNVGLVDAKYVWLVSSFLF
ncbi:cupin domain-containing protein [Sesbania bispinosa]|nr:cupin domain-containing protein [Sesbania bispinosa]